MILVLSFLNNPKDLDLSYKTDLDFWDCLGRKKLSLLNEEIWKLLIFCGIIILSAVEGTQWRPSQNMSSVLKSVERLPRYLKNTLLNALRKIICLEVSVENFHL